MSASLLPNLRRHPAVRLYAMIAAFALMLLLLALMDRDLEWWALLPVAVGAIALVVSWGLGPPLVIVLVTGLLVIQRRRPRIPGWEDDSAWGELAIALSLLTFAVAHYRLLALLRHVFPPDPRRHLGRALPPVRRSPELVSSAETSLLVILIPSLMALAIIGWLLLQHLPPRLELPPRLWQGALLVWLVATTLGIVSALRAYLRRAQASPEESLLYLQDQVWREMRREQGEVSRWTAWARRRAQKRKQS